MPFVWNIYTCLRTGIMAEYLVMSTSQGTYDRTAGRDEIYSIWNVQSGEGTRPVTENRWCSLL